MSAVISPCGAYRYRLDRSLTATPGVGGRVLAWIMVNPSKADATEDDPTIRKVRGFSTAAGATRFIVGNLFAYRATDVRELRAARDPIGPECDTYLREILREADAVVVAWGASAKVPRALRDRWRGIAALAAEEGKPLSCIGTALDGHPLHPLMQSYSRPLVPWHAPASIVEAAS